MACFFFSNLLHDTAAGYHSLAAFVRDIPSTANGQGSALGFGSTTNGLLYLTKFCLLHFGHLSTDGGFSFGGFCGRMKENVYGDEEMSENEKKKCFVITPIGEQNSEIRRHIDGIIDYVVKPALDEKFVVEVAHRNSDIGTITDRIIRQIYEADLVIANLTGLNPNVMYELAIRYAFGKPAIVIALSGTKLPFDMSTVSTLFYENDPTGAVDLAKRIKTYEEKIDYSKDDYGPVLSALSKADLYSRVEIHGEDQAPSITDVQNYLVDRLDKMDSKIDSIANRAMGISISPLNSSTSLGASYKANWLDINETLKPKRVTDDIKIDNDYLHLKNKNDL